MFLVLGTHNVKKGVELAALVAPLGIALKTLADFPAAIEVVEDGDSFAANARLKAVGQARHLGQWVLGEDSGICIDALDGAPGIFSARFAGEDATDELNNQRLLDDLGDLPPAKRTAHYTCHVTLADPSGEVRLECEDYCHGYIGREPIGEGGFGYDPLFVLSEYHRTFGQLGPQVKAALSHRGRAMRRLVQKLPEVVSSR